MSSQVRTHPARSRQARQVTLPRIAEMKLNAEPIVMVTAYDHPSAQVAEAAGVDMVLVGDSAAMTVLGYDSTVPVGPRRDGHARLGRAPRPEDATSCRRPALRLLRELRRAGRGQRDALRQGGRVRRGQARARRQLRRPRPRDHPRRHPGDGPRGADAADGHGAGRLQGPGQDRRACVDDRRRGTGPSGGRLFRDRLRGCPGRRQRGADDAA